MKLDAKYSLMVTGTARGMLTITFRNEPKDAIQAINQEAGWMLMSCSSEPPPLYSTMLASPASILRLALKPDQDHGMVIWRLLYASGLEIVEQTLYEVLTLRHNGFKPEIAIPAVEQQLTEIMEATRAKLPKDD